MRRRISRNVWTTPSAALKAGHSGCESEARGSGAVDFAWYGAAEGPKWVLQTDSALCHQLPSHEEQVAEGEKREELGAVLGQPPVAGLQITELALEHAEWMLEPGTDHGDNAVDVVVDGVEHAALGRLPHDAPELTGAGE